MTRILIVDDDQSISRLYERELRDEGHEVTVAMTGRAAIDCFRAERPDVVVLDIRMPGMDGLDIMWYLLSIDSEVPIILNSAYSSYKNNYLSRSADAYIAKSADISELRDAIQRVTSEAGRTSGRRESTNQEESYSSPDLPTLVH